MSNSREPHSDQSRLPTGDGPAGRPELVPDAPLAEFRHLQRIATIGQLAAEMTHELRQPLAAIRNYSEAALKSVQSKAIQEDALEEALATIFVQAGRALQITRRVTSYVRHSSEPRAPLAVAELIRGVLPLVDFEAERHSVELSVEADDSLPAVHANRGEIEQVLVNLLRNAVESVVDRDDPVRRRVDVHAKVVDGAMKIEVADTGTGIAADESRHLFEQFFTTKPEGLGLGLAVSRDLIHSHAGRIWAIPNKPHGAIFCFTLPLSG